MLKNLIGFAPKRTQSSTVSILRLFSATNKPIHELTLEDLTPEQLKHYEEEYSQLESDDNNEEYFKLLDKVGCSELKNLESLDDSKTEELITKLMSSIDNFEAIEQ